MYVCIYVCRHAWIHTHIHTYIHTYIFWVIVQYYFILLHKFFQLWSLGAFSVHFHVPWHTPEVSYHFVLFLFVHFLTFWTRCSMFILYICCFSPRISHFFKESWHLSLENDIKNQDLGTWCARCYCSVITSGPSR